MRLTAVILICCNVAFLPMARGTSSVITWGRNLNANAGKTNIPPDLTNVIAISYSGYPVLALLSDGTAVAWGERYNGPPFTNVVAIDAGYNHIMVRQRDGRLMARGYYGSTANLETALVGPPPYLPNVTAFTCGGMHDAALMNNGTVVAWGLNSLQTNVPPDLEDVVAIDAGRLHTLALKSDGTVAAWGENSYGQTDVPAGLSSVIAIAAGHFFSVALKSDGTLVGWGDNTFGQLNFAPDLTNIVAISAGRNHCFARRADGSLVVWGDNTYGQSTIPSDLPHVIAFAAGSYHNVVLAGPSAPTIYPANQAVHAGLRASFGVLAGGIGPIRYQWRLEGSDIAGATNVLLTLANVQPEDAGNYTVVVTDNSGSITSEPAHLTVVPTPLIAEQPTNQTAYLRGPATFKVAANGASPFYYQWQFEGTNIGGATNAILTFTAVSFRQAGAYSVIVSNRFGSVTSSIAQLTLSSVATWGRRDFAPWPIATNAVAISARGNSSLVLTREGSVVVWATSTGIPPAPADLTNIIAVSAGLSHGLALRADRTVAAWGANPATNVPAGLTNVIAIAAGNSHSVALRNDGTVVEWAGRAVPEGLSNVVEIAAGSSRTLALRNDGSVVTWGGSTANPPEELTNAVSLAASYWSVASRDYQPPVVWASTVGQSVMNIPSKFTNITAVAAGGSYGLALRADSTVGSWGYSSFGATNVPTGLTNVVAISAGNEHSLALVVEDLAESTPPEIRPVLSGESFGVSFPTRRGWRYRLEYKDSLADERWTMLPPVPGDGTVQVAADPALASRQRFYRLRQEQ